LDSNGDHQSDSEQTGKKILHYLIFEKKKNCKIYTRTIETGMEELTGGSWG
jgi:hypothetical protein